MTEEPAPSLDVDEFADTACECLNQFRDRAMDDSIQRSGLIRICFIIQYFFARDARSGAHGSECVKLNLQAEEGH